MNKVIHKFILFLLLLFPFTVIAANWGVTGVTADYTVGKNLKTSAGTFRFTPFRTAHFMFDIRIVELQFQSSTDELQYQYIYTNGSSNIERVKIGNTIMRFYPLTARIYPFHMASKGDYYSTFSPSLFFTYYPMSFITLKSNDAIDGDDSYGDSGRETRLKALPDFDMGINLRLYTQPFFHLGLSMGYYYTKFENNGSTGLIELKGLENSGFFARLSVGAFSMMRHPRYFKRKKVKQEKRAKNNLVALIKEYPTDRSERTFVKIENEIDKINSSEYAPTAMSITDTSLLKRLVDSKVLREAFIVKANKQLKTMRYQRFLQENAVKNLNAITDTIPLLTLIQNEKIFPEGILPNVEKHLRVVRLNKILEKNAVVTIDALSDMSQLQAMLEECSVYPPMSCERASERLKELRYRKMLKGYGVTEIVELSDTLPLRDILVSKGIPEYAYKEASKRLKDVRLQNVFTSFSVKSLGMISDTIQLNAIYSNPGLAFRVKEEALALLQEKRLQLVFDSLSIASINDVQDTVTLKLIANAKGLSNAIYSKVDVKVRNIRFSSALAVLEVDAIEEIRDVNQIRMLYNERTNYPISMRQRIEFHFKRSHEVEVTISMPVGGLSSLKGKYDITTPRLQKINNKKIKRSNIVITLPVGRNVLYYERIIKTYNSLTADGLQSKTVFLKPFRTYELTPGSMIPILSEETLEPFKTERKF